MGVCYDGVEGLLYLSLFSLLAACALSALLCTIFRLWTLMGSRSAPSQPPFILLRTAHNALLRNINACTMHSLFCPCLLCAGAPHSSRDKEYDDIDEEDPFNPQARRMSYNPRRSNIHSFCSYTSSFGSQASLHPPPQSTSSAAPPPEYM